MSNHCLEVMMDFIIQMCVIGYFVSMIAVCLYAIWFLRTVLRDLDIEIRSE